MHRTGVAPWRGGLWACSLRLAALAALLGSTACATTGQDEPAGERPPGAGQRAASSAGDALAQPLRDLGLIRPVIAPELSRIVDPYAPPMGPGCTWISYELTGLEDVLGSEQARAATQRRSTGEIVERAAADSMRSAMGGLIPARGLVRQLSGAQAADRALAEATERGRVRRAYLTGLAHAASCATSIQEDATEGVITVPGPVPATAPPAPSAAQSAQTPADG
jgi:hypothetical protein